MYIALLLIVNKKKMEKTLTPGQFFDLLIILSDEGKGPRDWQGELDYQEIIDIAHSAREWSLMEVPLETFDWVADPSFPNVSDFPPIVIAISNGTYDVLDGKHRVGMAKAREEVSLAMWVGEI